MPGDIWGIVLIIGPLVLLGVIIWVWQRNRAAGAANFQKAERGARELREDIERDPDPS